MDNNKPLIIVISRNYSTGLGVIRSLGSKGYTVDLIASVKKSGSSKIASSSKYVRNSTEVLTKDILKDDGTAIINEILQYKECKDFEKVVLFPVDDFTVSIVDAHRKELENYFLIPGVTANSDYSMHDAVDKTIQFKVANEVGLKTPSEWVITLDDSMIIPSDIIYPCFVKPLSSVTGRKTEMKRCNSYEQLSAHLKNLRNSLKDRSILVQEFLFIDREYNLSGVCNDQNVFIPSIIEKTRVAKHETGVAISGRMVSTDIIGDMKEKIISMLKMFRYIGMFDIDLCKCGDTFYFSEINFRSGGSNYFYYLQGVNLPAIFINEITGVGHREDEEIICKLGKSFVYEKVAWEDYINSYIDKVTLKEILASADCKLLCDNTDVAPGRFFNRRIRMSSFKHRLVNAIIGKNRKTKTSINSSNGTVVLVGCNYCNLLAMARDFGIANYNIEILRLFKKKSSPINLLNRMKPEAYSKYVTNYHQCSAYANDNCVMDHLNKLACANEKKVLVPVDDFSVSMVDKSFDTLSSHYILPNANKSANGIIKFMDKQLQKELAKTFNLPVLSSVIINFEESEPHIPKEVKYPCFVKPNISMKSTKGWMSKCDNQDELRNVLNKLAQKGGIDVLVEDFADIKTEYSILGLCIGGKAYSPGLLKVELGGHRERKGVALTGKLVDCAEHIDFIESCNKLIESIQFEGLFDIDLIETTDGRLYFIEVNFRPGASTNILLGSNINLAQLYANAVCLGLAADFEKKALITNKVFLSEKILIEEYTRGDISFKKVKELMSKSDIFLIKDKDDIKPYKKFKKYYIIAALMKLPYKIRDDRRKNEKQ